MTSNEKFYKIALTVLLAMVGYFCSQYIMKLNEIQKQISKLQIEVVKVQSQLIGRDEIRELVKEWHETHPCVVGGKK